MGNWKSIKSYKNEIGYHRKPRWHFLPESFWHVLYSDEITVGCEIAAERIRALYLLAMPVWCWEKGLCSILSVIQVTVLYILNAISLVSKTKRNSPQNFIWMCLFLNLKKKKKSAPVTLIIIFFLHIAGAYIEMAVILLMTTISRRHIVYTGLTIGSANRYDINRLLTLIGLTQVQRCPSPKRSSF